MIVKIVLERSVTMGLLIYAPTVCVAFYVIAQWDSGKKKETSVLVSLYFVGLTTGLIQASLHLW